MAKYSGVRRDQVKSTCFLEQKGVRKISGVRSISLCSEIATMVFRAKAAMSSQTGRRVRRYLRLEATFMDPTRKRRKPSSGQMYDGTKRPTLCSDRASTRLYPCNCACDPGSRWLRKHLSGSLHRLYHLDPAVSRWCRCFTERRPRTHARPIYR